MAKIGRNEPCHCGSGKKYKKCCEPRDQQAATERARLLTALSDEATEFDELSDRVSELIDAGRLDEAEPLARQLEAEYPDDEFGTECLAMIYEARGLHLVAADHYRRAVAAIDARGTGNFCDCCRARLVEGVVRLDPEGPVPPPADAATAALTAE